MTTQSKRQVVKGLRLDEISSVDSPAQVEAVAVLMKRADGGDVEIRKNAGEVAAGGKPAFGVLQYEDAMLRRAEELARDYRVSLEQALAKGLSADRELMDLAHACEVARVGAYGQEVRKRLGAP